jgi:Family of unknown function (DUF5309)
MTANQVVREDLSDALILSDVRNTPFTSRMRKGERLTNMLFSWTLEDMGARRTDPPPENADVNAFETDQQIRLYNRAQRFWRTPRVSVIAEKVNDTAGNFGKYVSQVKKKTEDQKRDIEYVLLSTQDSNDDTGIVGSRTLGIGQAINASAGTDTQTIIPAAYRTPAAQIYSSTLTTFDEEDMIDILVNRYNSLGQTTELVLFAGSALKRRISQMFGKYKADVSGYTVVVRTVAEAIDSRKFQGYGISKYEGDFGSFEIVLVPFISDQKYGYLVNMDTVKMRPLMYADHTRLPYQGGGISGLIDSILGWEFGDPRGHAAIKAT